MIKIRLLSLVFVLAGLTAQAQEAKRYILLEHFTNTVCGICASKNPAFFNTLNQYPERVHHIAYHPPVPYTSCELYKHNPNENASRSNYYDIFGTPKVFLNGTATGPGPLITEAALNNSINLTSPLGIEVTETSGNDREVSVSIKTYGTAPSGNLKLYVAIAEETLNYNSPNGESVHHDVFRQFLANAEDFTPAADGSTVDLSYTYSIDSDWQADEIYVMAYVQNDDTKEIINSGNRFDEATPVSNKDLSADRLSIQVSPNPASDYLYLDLGTVVSETSFLSLQDATGKQVWSTRTTAKNVNVAVDAFPAGLYFLRLQRGEQSQVVKVILQ